jgi:hypothetical protein
MPKDRSEKEQNMDTRSIKISQILDTWVAGVSEEEAPIRVFENVRDIPYGTIGSRDPLSVFEMNRGTCSGKHFLLGDLYRMMGISVKDMVARHMYADLPRRIEYPNELKDLVSRGQGIPDYHNFIKVYFNGRWSILDATFDRGLRDYFVVNEWRGMKDTELSVEAQDVWEVTHPRDFKISKLSKLAPEVQRKREAFLRGFSEWLETLRGQSGES